MSAPSKPARDDSLPVPFGTTTTVCSTLNSAVTDTTIAKSHPHAGLGRHSLAKPAAFTRRIALMLIPHAAIRTDRLSVSPDQTGSIRGQHALLPATQRSDFAD